MQVDPLSTALNEHQRRHFEVVLAMLEETMVAVEQLAVPSVHSHDALTVYADDLPAGFHEEIRPVVAAIRRRATQLVTRLELRPRRVSRARSVRALLVAAIVRLEDSTAEKLTGYGAVDSRVGGEIEPLLSEIRSLLTEIVARVEGRTLPVRTRRLSEDQA